MLPPDLASITERDLIGLVNTKTHESRVIEFKAVLAMSSDWERKELLADVSSFANASGGDIVFGIEELEGVASKVVGLDGFAPDSDQLRLEEVIRNGIEPRIAGLRMQSVQLENGRRTLVIRIPSSLNAPHMVTFKGASRFYSRNSKGKYQLDVQELRAAFIASESLSDRIRQFRLERIEAILQKRTPEPLAGEHYICLHVIPLQAFNHSIQFDLERAKQSGDELRPVNGHGWSPSVNYDGLLTTSRASGASSPQATSYVQLFRNGIVEAVESYLLKVESQVNRRLIPSVAYEREVIQGLKHYLDFYRQYGMPTPVLIAVSLLNVREFCMYVGPGRWEEPGRLIDRDHLILQEQAIESFDLDPGSVLRPAFEQIWNACGWSRDINYDEEGRWKPRQ